MCVVSMVGDHYRDKWVPDIVPFPKSWPNYYPLPDTSKPAEPPPTRAEFDKLQKEVREMIALLKRAKKYDRDNGEPDCEVDEKMALLRKVAALVGIDLDAVLAK